VKPQVCISGHIHESAALDTIGPTTIVNAGRFDCGGYVIVRSQGKALAASLEFI
jgi:Icc-related predicted phosphoesterase